MHAWIASHPVLTAILIFILILLPLGALFIAYAFARGMSDVPMDDD